MTTPLDPELPWPRPPEPDVGRHARRRRQRRRPVIVLLVLGVACLAGGGAALVRELTRTPTRAEQATALQREIATRWERLNAGQVFPATLTYRDATGDTVAARRVGIAPPASCRSALEPGAYQQVRGLGCSAVLRATYVDAGGALAATVGVAVMRSPAAAQQARGELIPLRPGAGLHAVSFPGTITAQFQDAARGADSGQAAGPYLFFYTVGFTDGLPGAAGTAEQDELVALGSGVAGGLQAVLTGGRTIRRRLASGGALLAATLAASVALPAAAVAQPAAPASGRPAIPATAVGRLASEMSSAWQITDGKGVTVAVLTTAVKPVSDLAGKLTIGPNYAPLPGAPATAGTVLASLIAGSGPTGSNSLGAVGRAPGARILAVRVLNASAGAREQQYESDGVWQGIVGKAIRYAVDHGAGVIVAEESGAQDSAALDSAVQYALSKNVVVIGTGYAYGTNLKSTTPAYPDSLPGVINFSGRTLSGLPAPPQQEHYAANSSVLVTAPDNALPATGPGNQSYVAYNELTALAWVAGTVALIKSVYPQITPGMVADALALSASYHPAGGYNTAIGFGLINPLGALHEAATLTKLRATAAPGPGTLSAGARLGGTPPGAVNAVQHPVATLAGSGTVVGAGAVLLLLAVRLKGRGRRARAGQHSSARHA